MEISRILEAPNDVNTCQSLRQPTSHLETQNKTGSNKPPAKEIRLYIEARRRPHAAGVRRAAQPGEDPAERH